MSDYDRLSAEDVMQNLLPVVVKAATRAAEASTLAASALASFEATLKEQGSCQAYEQAKVRKVLEDLQRAIKDLDSAVGILVPNEAARKGSTDIKKATISVVQPEIIWLTLVIIATALGIRLTVPALSTGTSTSVAVVPIGVENDP